MTFSIRNVANGVVLRIEPQQPGEEATEVVYQDTADAEIEAFADFLRYLLDNYGPQTSRYSPKRIYIRTEPGDKYEPPAEEHP